MKKKSAEGKRSMKAKVRLKKLRYTVVIEQDEETGQYCVSVPALPGCFTQGDTFEEAVANAKECIEGFIEALQKVGKPIPVEVPVDAEVAVG